MGSNNPKHTRKDKIAGEVMLLDGRKAKVTRIFIPDHGRCHGADDWGSGDESAKDVFLCDSDLDDSDRVIASLLWIPYVHFEV